MRRLRRILPCLLGVTLAAGGLEARATLDRLLETDGTVHRVAVEYWPQYPGPGTAIRYTRQAPNGQLSSVLLPGTDDVFLDREPAITIDPKTHHPVAVWSRFEKVGFDLFASSFDGTAWSTPRQLLPPNPDRVRPSVKSDGALIHVFWTSLGGNASRVARASFLPGDLTLVLGPEPARVNCVDPAASSTLAPPAVGDPPKSDTYFAAEVPGPTPSDPPLLGVWGVRDEPVPIDFRAAFTLPGGAHDLKRVDAAMISGRLTVWFEWSGGLWYTYDDGLGSFTPLRVIKRESGGFTTDSLILLRELIDRLPPVTH